MHLSTRPSVNCLVHLERNTKFITTANSSCRAISTSSSSPVVVFNSSPSSTLSRHCAAKPRLLLQSPPQPQLLTNLINNPSHILLTGRRQRLNTITTIATITTTRNMSTSASITTTAGKRLAGKTVLITGASSGIGKACAVEFALACPSDNLRIILAARRIDTIKEIAADITKQVGAGVKIHPLQLDVSKPDEVRTFVSKLPEEFKNVDILVNNAGLVKGLDRAPEIAEEDINVMFDTNVTGLINVTQAVLPTFLARPDGGAGDIVNIGSIAGREPYAGGSIYCATKAAVRSFSDSLRRELVHTQVRVMVVDPGQVETEFSVVRFRGDQAKADATYAGVEPLTPADIAEIVVFNVTRRQNVVIADSLIYHTAQAGAGAIHRK